MKKVLLMAVCVMVSMTSFGRKSVVLDNAKVVTDTIFYADNMQNVAKRAEASYYRLLKTQNVGAKKQEVFQDFYMNGTLKAEGGYSFTLQLRDGGIAVIQFENGKSKFDYFTVTQKDGTMQKRPIDELKSLL